MKNKLMKCGTFVLTIALVFLLSTPVFAESGTTGPTVTLKSTDEQKNRVIELSLAGIPEKNEIKGISFVLEMDNAEFGSFNFAQDNTDEYNANVNLESNNKRATVYITSKALLNSADGTLKIGKLEVKGENGVKYTIKPSNLKMVNNTSFEQTKIEEKIPLTSGTTSIFELKEEIEIPKDPEPGKGDPEPGKGDSGAVKSNPVETKSDASVTGRNPLVGILGENQSYILVVSAGLIIVGIAFAVVLIKKKRKIN